MSKPFPFKPCHHKMGPKNLSRKRRVTRRTQTKALRTKLKSLKTVVPVSERYPDWAEEGVLAHFSYEWRTK